MPRILIVDDALVMRKMIGSIAAEAGWEIVGEGENGQRGVDLYSLHQPDLVTMDLVMPVMGGLDALRHIRQANPAARVVVITALNQKQTLVDAIEAGAADFIVKPFQKEHVRGVLQKFAAEIGSKTNGNESKPLDI